MNLDGVSLYDPAALRAIAPLVSLSVGALLLLVASITPRLHAARGLVVAGSLVSALIQLIGLWKAPPGLVLGGSFEASSTTALWGLLFISATLLAWLFSIHYYTEDKPFKDEHDVLLLCTPIGMMLMAGAQDLLVFFIGLELLSIPLYALASFRRSRPRSVEAGMKYFLLGAFAAAFFLYGAALVYADTGTIALAELREMGVSGALAGTGTALMMASLFFKISVFPFHLWVPDVYQGSPTPVTALMATGTKAAAFAFLFNAAFLIPPSAAMTVAVIALVTMAAGNLGALVQSDVKRMLAYSGIAHAGTVLLLVAGFLAGDGNNYVDGAGSMHTQAVHAALFYLGAYVFTAAGSFGLLALLESCGEGTTLESLRGLSRRRPAVAAAMALFLLSLGGIPATGGFLGKYLVFTLAVRADMVAVAVIGALLSVVALGYYLRVIVAMYMQPETETGAPRIETSMGLTMPATLAAGVCAALVIAMGVLPGWFLSRM